MTLGEEKGAGQEQLCRAEGGQAMRRPESSSPQQRQSELFTLGDLPKVQGLVHELLSRKIWKLFTKQLGLHLKPG